MELDIFIPSNRLGTEYDGVHWHKTEKEHAREIQKYEICKSHNITLHRVKEKNVEWNDVADGIYFINNRRDKKELTQVIQAIVNSIDPEVNIWTRKNPFKSMSDTIVDLERDTNEIRSYLIPIPYSISDLRPDLVEDWDYEKNGTLRPEMFGIHSNETVWWKCHVCGHSWKTMINHRGGKRNSGCPECSKIKRGKAFTKGVVLERGSLAETNPELAKEWHPTKNGDLKPEDITEGRFKPVWWLCPKCGYEWEASPNNRKKGIGCPCCSGRVPMPGVNDLATVMPELLKEWDYEKNKVGPENYLPKSGKKVWWKCQTCGHEWKTVISNRSNGHGCPKCRKRKK
jgi:rubrerythrin